MCKDQIIFQLNCVFKEYIVHNHFILTVLTLAEEKVILNAQISERTQAFKLFTAANERNAEAEKRQNKIGIIFSPSEDRKYIEINKSS